MAVVALAFAVVALAFVVATPIECRHCPSALALTVTRARPLVGPLTAAWAEIVDNKPSAAVTLLRFAVD